MAAGGTVTISVSRGPAPVQVPDVVGALASDAKTSLQNRGFVPVSVSTSGTPAQVGRVIGQDPDAGTRLASGNAVRIFVGE
jgi:serine/threonine-protein kinase